MPENRQTGLTNTAQFRFYEELNDFLPPERRKRTFSYRFRGTPSVKDAIQALGVPHSAVDLILVNGEPVTFEHRLINDERIAVYPVFESLDISPIYRLRPEPLRKTRFILDVHLGKCARYLRMLGFDCVYEPDWDDDRIIDFALEDKRIVLTRDRGILKQTRVTHGYWVRSKNPVTQVREVLAALDLAAQVKPFTLCLNCNGSIQRIGKEHIAGEVDPAILSRFDAFWQCRDCGRIYWRGSHHERMLKRIEMLKAPPDYL